MNDTYNHNEVKLLKTWPRKFRTWYVWLLYCCEYQRDMIVWFYCIRLKQVIRPVHSIPYWGVGIRIKIAHSYMQWWCANKLYIFENDFLYNAFIVSLPWVKYISLLTLISHSSSWYVLPFVIHTDIHRLLRYVLSQECKLDWKFVSK